MTFFRWFAGAPFAAAVTLFLFAFMAGLIRPPFIEYKNPQPSPEFKITMEPPAGQKPAPKNPKDTIPDEAPEVIIKHPRPSPSPGPRYVAPEGTKTASGQGGAGARFTTPPIRTTPLYPEACRSRNAEGLVTVQFDVTPEGNVVNIKILKTPDQCFVRTVRNTVSKWKYPPAYENGRAAMRYGLVEVFKFELMN